MTKHVTNEGIASRLGMHHSSISRIRSGDRTPNRDTMLLIEDRLGWKVEEQIRAAVEGEYPERFEAFIQEHLVDEDPAP